MRLGVLAILVLAVAACGQNNKGPAFDGQYFRAKAKKLGDDRAVIGVEVKPASASMDGAREAGRYAATEYCIKNFGTSDIVWVRGPDAEDGTLTVENDTLLLQGTCTVL